MIVRILTARVRPEKAGEFNDLLRKQLDDLKGMPGLVYVKLAHAVHRDGDEVVLFEEWRDIPSLYAWAGPQLSSPRLIPGAEELVEDVRVTHYEALDMEPPPD